MGKVGKYSMYLMRYIYLDLTLNLDLSKKMCKIISNISLVELGKSMRRI